MKKRFFAVILTAALTSLLTFFLAAQFYNGHTPLTFTAQKKNTTPVFFTGDGNTTVKGAAPVDFQPAAEASVNAVVHIKTTTKGRTVVAQDPNDDFFGFFGPRQYYMPPQMGSGSGVVISPDGYIVTNNHVIANTQSVTVTFNDRYTATARLIGTDPSTDIALLKVEGAEDRDFPYMEFGNSDNVHLGQWVLAVGYPLTLDATVTAGIVSAKSRAIGINRTQSNNAIESFIQTDAAVNPGNSGGALVNTNGQLIGINSAIASPTGSYAGYSYAIPANIVRKVVNDLKQYGTVQRGYLGIQYLDRKNASPEQSKALGLDRNDGVYVYDVAPNLGAAASGLKKGDFIVQINGVPVHSEPELLEQIARYKPGDNVGVTYVRDGKAYNTTVELKNINGTTSVLKPEAPATIFGATLRTLTGAERQKLGVRGGVILTDVGKGALRQQTNMRNGFVITSINDSPVQNVTDLQQAAAAANGPLQIAGFYPGYKGMYYYGLNP